MSISNYNIDVDANRYKKTYFNGYVDVSGNMLVRGANSLWLDTTASIKLNGGTVVTLSNLELATLDGITTGVSIQSQINSKGTDITTLNTKTQNLTATNLLTTFANGITITTGNLTLTNGNIVLTSGDLSIILG